MTDEELQEYCYQAFRPKRKTYELTESDMQEIARQVHADFEKAVEETRRMAEVLDGRGAYPTEIVEAPKKWWQVWR